MSDIYWLGWIRGRDLIWFLYYEGGGFCIILIDVVCFMYIRVWDIIKIVEDFSELCLVIFCE